MPSGLPTADVSVFIQIEITTTCNFRCFYCAGRDMPQQSMSETRFDEILGKLPPGRHLVSLQGEGEPTMHPEWWTLVGKVRARGHRVTTITNGYLVDTERLSKEMEQISVSVDTLDAEEATRIGRYKLSRVLESVDDLIRRMGNDRVIIMTVDYGQDVAAVREWASRLRVHRHIVQPLQRKPDYAYRYADRIAPRSVPRGLSLGCRYLERPLMRYYDINGAELPCCFIKDVSKFESREATRAALSAGDVPGCCAGCRYLVPRSRLATSR